MAYRNYSPAVGLIVDQNGHGDFTTIGAALAVATAGDTIFINQGTYTENLTGVSNVTLTSWPTGGFSYDGSGVDNTVTITGKLTASFASSGMMFSGISFFTNGSNAFTQTNTGNLYFQNCYFQSGTNAIFSNTGSGRLYMWSCTGDLTGSSASFFSIACSSAQTTIVNNCTFNSTGAGAATSFGAQCNVTMNNTSWQSQITLATSGVITTSNSNFAAGSASCFSIGSGCTANITNSTLNSSNTNVLTGAGTLNYALLAFSGSSSGANVSTMNPLATLI